MPSDEGFELVDALRSDHTADPIGEPKQENCATPEQKSEAVSKAKLPTTGPPGSLDLLRLALADVEIDIGTVSIAIARACQSVLAGPRDIDEQEATQEAMGILFIYAVENIGRDHADYLAICSAISANTGPAMCTYFGRPEGCCIYM